MIQDQTTSRVYEYDLGGRLTGEFEDVSAAAGMRRLWRDLRLSKVQNLADARRAKAGKQRRPRTPTTTTTFP